MSKSDLPSTHQVDLLAALTAPIKACGTCTWWLGHIHQWDFPDLYPCGHPEHNIVLDKVNTIKNVGAEDCCDRWQTFNNLDE